MQMINLVLSLLLILKAATINNLSRLDIAE